jgi:hypothetical protein
MGFFDRKAEELAVRFIAEFTGQHVVPKVCVPCESSHTHNWNGYCVLTEDALFLVNKRGARGVRYEGISGTGSWGQYPAGTKGFPTYRFGFLFNGQPGGFTVFSKTQDGGRQLEEFLNKIYTPAE